MEGAVKEKKKTGRKEKDPRKVEKPRPLRMCDDDYEPFVEEAMLVSKKGVSVVARVVLKRWAKRRKKRREAKMKGGE